MNTKIIRSALVAIVAVGAAITTTAPAFADDAAQAHVALHGLNLSDAADRGLVQQRIHASARKVCGTAEGGTLSERLAARHCYLQAVKNGNAQLAGIEAHRSAAFASR